MKKLFFILLVISIVSCAKLKDENKIYIGQYEWFYSESHTIGPDSNSSYSDPNTINSRCALVVTKSQVQYYRNDTLIEKYRIKDVKINENGTCSIFAKGINFYIDHGILSTTYLPFDYENESNKDGVNKFELRN